MRENVNGYKLPENALCNGGKHAPVAKRGKILVILVQLTLEVRRSMFTETLVLRRKLLPFPWNFFFIRNTNMLLVVEQRFTLKLLDTASQVLLLQSVSDISFRHLVFIAVKYEF